MDPRTARSPAQDRLAAAAGPIAGQLVRFGIVGVVVNLALYGAYLLLLGWQVTPLFAMSIVYVCGVLSSFFLHGRWTFGGAVRRRQFGAFCAVHVAGYALNGVGLWWLLGKDLSPQYSQAIMVLAVAAMSFLLQKVWVFRVPLPEGSRGR